MLQQLGPNAKQKLWAEIYLQTAYDQGIAPEDKGEYLPDYMWSNRLQPRTPMPAIFLCGAGTHPGNSVIAINGRNAAMEVLRD